MYLIKEGERILVFDIYIIGGGTGMSQLSSTVTDPTPDCK
jgi:hypothetical protein